MNKISKTIIGIALSVAVVAPVSGAVAYKAMTTDASAQTTASSVVTTTVKTTKTEAVTALPISLENVKTQKAVESKKTTKDGKTTKAEVKTKAQKENLKPSKLLAGKTSVSRWSASNGKMKVNAEKIKLNLNGATRYAYVAVIKGPASGFKSYASILSTGKTVDSIANLSKFNNLTFSVNGEMCNHDKESFKGFYNSADDSTNGTVIKGSKIAQAVDATPSLTMTKDGKWEYPVLVGKDNAQSLINSGVITSVGYTYPVLWNGEPYYVDGGVLAPMWNERDTKADNYSKHFYNDHTLIGQIDANTYVVAISEGFGRGYLCDIMQEMGVQNAFWENGGHCASMYIKGYGVVNRPGDNKLCSAADIMGF